MIPVARWQPGYTLFKTVHYSKPYSLDSESDHLSTKLVKGKRICLSYPIPRSLPFPKEEGGHSEYQFFTKSGLPSSGSACDGTGTTQHQARTRKPGIDFARLPSVKNLLYLAVHSFQPRGTERKFQYAHRWCFMPKNARFA